MNHKHDATGLKGRVEDTRLIKGAGSYVDDLHVEKMAYMGLVRSPYAHAKIKRIDFSKARSSPEYVASLTAEDLFSDGVSPLLKMPDSKPAKRYHLAHEKVRHAGEAVAAILVESRYAVEDLLDEVEVEYEELPVVTSIEDSKLRKSILYEDWNDNVSVEQEIKKGDASAAIASSPYVIRAKMGIRRQAGVPIEPRALLVFYNRKNGVYEVDASVQSANRLQNYLSAELKQPKEKFHVRVKDVGGSFGTKGAQSNPENVLACIFAKRTGRAVKWASTRTEDLLETAAGRDEYCDIELACSEEGKIVALRATVECDSGVSGTMSRMPLQTLMLLPGGYKIPNLDLRATVYVTNKTPLGPVRGAGRPEASFFMERAIDIMARKMGIDPLELRRRNVILPEEFPYENGAGYVYDSGNFPLLLKTLAEVSSYDDLESSTRNRNMKNDRRVQGIGICLEIEDTGALLTESSKVTLHDGGEAVTVYTGSSPHGQGHETTLAQLCSEELGFPLNRITVKYGDTDLIPTGTGTFGSRSAATGGSAVVEAARRLKMQILDRTSEILGVRRDSIDLKNGAVVVIVPPSEAGSLLTLEALLEKLGTNEISANSDYKMSSLTFASGAHLCVVNLDVETGKAAIARYVAVDDCGRVINEAIVDGQIHGGVAHGVGGALYEQVVYDENGRLLTSNFLDYTIPTAVESPNVEVFHVETPSSISLDGAKGVGESGTMAAYPAVINALNDALSQLDRGTTEYNFAPAVPNTIFDILKQRKSNF